MPVSSLRSSPISPLYPILDARLLPRSRQARLERLGEIAVAFAGAGVSLLQYRNKEGSDAEVLEDARWLRERTPAGLRILLNDRAHLVVPSGCAGVHVGQSDLSVEEARVLVGPERLVGLSTHSEAQLLAGDASEADYLAVGPVYLTGSKADAEAVVGLAGVRQARALTGKPLVAIGGITLERAAEVREAGADSLAVISGLFGDATNGGSPEALRKLAEDFLRVFR